MGFTLHMIDCIILFFMLMGKMSSVCMWFPSSSARAFLGFWRVSSPDGKLPLLFARRSCQVPQAEPQDPGVAVWQRLCRSRWPMGTTSGCTPKLHPPHSRVSPCPAIFPLMSLKYSQLSQDLHDSRGYCAQRKPRKKRCVSAVLRRDSQVPWWGLVCI